MLRATLPTGIILESDDATQLQQVLAAVSTNQAYTVEQLAARLNISQRSAYDLVRDGKIDHCCAGSTKGYRIGELAVRDYERSIKAA